MSNETMIERFFEALIAGDRPMARQVVEHAKEITGNSADLITDLFWPTHQYIERLYRSDQISCLSHHMATRLMRVLVDQNAAEFVTDTTEKRSRVLAFCGESESDELGAQMAVDLLEGAGFAVKFGGGGIASDEVIAAVQEEQPDVLVMFCSAPQDLPGIRRTIDTLHEIASCPRLQVAVGGGVFNRADGLAEEIGADVWALTPIDLVELLIERPQQRSNAATARTAARTRRRRSVA